MKNILDSLRILNFRKKNRADKEYEVVPIVDILPRLEDLEYIDAMNDKENLQNDMRNVIKDLETGIKECKKQYRIEYC